MTRSRAEIEQVRQCHAAGLTDRAASQVSGVPINTIRSWRNQGTPRSRREGVCPRCGAPTHAWDIEVPDPYVYCYLPGLYLGDGCLRRWGQGWTLRISLDVSYPGIIEECSAAMTALRGREPKIRPESGGSACVNVTSSWVGWPCLFPQHGPGRKHTRRIELTAWQRELVAEAPGSLLRGLIHSDGWRGVNRVEAKGRRYVYPRYQFSNRSDDIRAIFTDSCEALGIEWRQWTRFHVSVAKRESVARLDAFVGPKR